MKPIKIQHNSTAKSNISINSLSNDVFENIFDEDSASTEVSNFETDLIVMDLDNININNSANEPANDLTTETQNNVTLKSNSTCSSRTSYTLDGEAEDDIDDCENCDNCDNHKNGEDTDEDKNENEDEDADDDEDNWEDESDIEERIDVVIPKFPVQVICMEYC